MHDSPAVQLGTFVEDTTLTSEKEAERSRDDSNAQLKITLQLRRTQSSADAVKH